MRDMRDDWRDLCQAGDLTAGSDEIRVTFAGGRSHSVRVGAAEDGYVLTAHVADADVVEMLDDPYEDVWMRNRRTRFVGFRVDDNGRLVAHGWTPVAGLTAEAFQLVVRAVAREADRYELQLTGADIN
jgi:hypothetical protein